MSPRIRLSLWAALLTLLAAQVQAVPAAAADSPAAPPAAPASAAQLIESLGLHVAPTPVRERKDWHPPRVILV